MTANSVERDDVWSSYFSDRAKINDAKTYENDLNQLARTRSYPQVKILNKLDFPATIKIRILNAPQEAKGKIPSLVPPIEYSRDPLGIGRYERFDLLRQALLEQIEPHLKNPEVEIYIQRAVERVVNSPERVVA